MSTDIIEQLARLAEEPSSEPWEAIIDGTDVVALVSEVRLLRERAAELGRVRAELGIAISTLRVAMGHLPPHIAEQLAGERSPRKLRPAGRRGPISVREHRDGARMTGEELAVFMRWARRAVVVQGGELAKMLVGGDVNARAWKLLQEAERVGWIERRRYSPTREHMFFGDSPREAAEHPGYRNEGWLYAWEVTPKCPCWEEEA